jgi:hypothetical protein
LGTKLKPGKFDCYEKAEPDEPMFTLLARDPTAPLLIRIWAMMQVPKGKEIVSAEKAEKLEEAI